MVPQHRNSGAGAEATDQDVSIRVANPADLAELHALDTAVFGELAYPFFVLRQSMDVQYGCWLVAEHRSRMLGYSYGVPTMDRRTGWLLGLGVRPEFRRRGFGLRLTAESLAALRTFGVRTARLTVHPGNAVALGLYRRLHFTVEQRVRDYLGPGEDRLLMARTV
ncbi:MAG TPA: N-acetyltransferase [Pseudonocardiaceae bacterium]|jgi:ribosomal protein S18 acetylase RimI-like enzyme|nr:N-acetyltransferase [Pseudonocardiaceae bacterium]